MTRREYRSRMTARYSQPSLVQMQLISPAYYPTGDACIAVRAFLVRAIRSEVLIQQVGRDVEPVVAVSPSSGK
jgi:hypothetical protein